MCDHEHKFTGQIYSRRDPSHHGRIEEFELKCTKCGHRILEEHRTGTINEYWFEQAMMIMAEEPRKPLEEFLRSVKIEPTKDWFHTPITEEQFIKTATLAYRYYWDTHEDETKYTDVIVKELSSVIKQNNVTEIVLGDTAVPASENIIPETLFIPGLDFIQIRTVSLESLRMLLDYCVAKEYYKAAAKIQQEIKRRAPFANGVSTDFILLD
jgi:hypothetical protein